jgi:hypothetical protein
MCTVLLPLDVNPIAVKYRPPVGLCSLYERWYLHNSPCQGKEVSLTSLKIMTLKNFSLTISLGAQFACSALTFFLSVYIFRPILTFISVLHIQEVPGSNLEANYTQKLLWFDSIPPDMLKWYLKSSHNHIQHHL